MTPDDPRAATNPLFNANRFKLGVFNFNGKGAQISRGAGPDVTWARNLDIAGQADRAGFEAIVPYTRWKGRPQVDEATKHAPHDIFETFTWAAGLAQATERACIFSTVSMPIVHPIIAAKQAATIDHISGGRFAMNIVAGWNAPEFAMFGQPLKGHDDRYAQAEEWMEIVHRLWTEDEFDFAGDYYSIVAGEAWPKPLQQPFPAIMNAGGSDRGARFAARYADLCFVMVKGGDMDELAAQVGEYKRIAREEFGRDVQVWTTTDVIVRPTEAEAADEARRQTEALNPAYLKQLAEMRGAQAKPMQVKGRAPSAVVATARDIVKLIGTPAIIVDQIVALERAGIAGTLLTSEVLEQELPLWNAQVMPLLAQAGLRSADA